MIINVASVFSGVGTGDFAVGLWRTRRMIGSLRVDATEDEGFEKR